VLAFIITTETTLAILDPALGFAMGGLLFALVLVGLVGLVVAYVILGFVRGR
jgi:asparagine N-glycosylation enzyme membrane subunit Stt3